jgi:hypothetical protein
VRQIVAQRESPVMLRVWGRLERVPDDDANCAESSANLTSSIMCVGSRDEATKILPT